MLGVAWGSEGGIWDVVGLLGGGSCVEAIHKDRIESGGKGACKRCGIMGRDA